MYQIFLLGAAAALFLFGCSKEKKVEQSSTDSPTKTSLDPDQIAGFVEIKKDTYWHDLNFDGIPKPYETFFVSPGQDRITEANRFIKSHPYAFSPCLQWTPKFLPGPVSQYFQHPEKDRMSRQLAIDIQKLKSMIAPPKIYSELLKDLEMIQEELPHVGFRYPNPGEVPKGFIGVYDQIANEMVVARNAPISLLIHEMDHRLTKWRRVEEWSQPFKLRCDPFRSYDIPKAPHLPSPNRAKVQYSFSLDYKGEGQNHFTYNDVDAEKPFFRSLIHLSEPCFPEESKRAVLANEVRGYLTMARYLLFRVGFTDLEIHELRSGHYGKRLKLREGLRSHLRGSNLNFLWANELVLHYLGVGGVSGKENLTKYVRDYYVRMQAPGFVDPPGCKK